MTKFASIGVFGRANAGKSTLINALVKERVSIVSKRPQTTRRRVMGIVTIKDTQLVFCDTPGLHEIKNKLDVFMQNEIISTLNGLDYALYVADAADLKLEDDKKYLKQVCEKAKIQFFFVLNKIDLIDKNAVNSALEQFNALYEFKKSFAVSAYKQKGLKSLITELCEAAPEGEFAYDKNDYTNQTEREIVEEVIRETALQLFSQEVPHSIAITVEQFKERDNQKTYIEAIIYVEKEGHKKIILGKGGAGIKTLGKVSRQRLNEMLRRDIFLQLWLKVKKNWRRDEQMIKRFGYKK